jgi:hypothetical protein
MVAMMFALLMSVPMASPVVNVTVPGKHIRADAVKITHAAADKCQSTSAKRVRLIIHNAKAGSVYRVTLDCRTGRLTPATAQ